MAAAARARDDGRTEFSISDVLLALTQDDQAGELLADLGIDEQAVRETGNRPAAIDEPPEAAPEPE
jgi:hypothetical protein